MYLLFPIYEKLVYIFKPNIHIVKCISFGPEKADLFSKPILFYLLLPFDGLKSKLYKG